MDIGNNIEIKPKNSQKQSEAEIKKIDILPLYPQKKDNRCGSFGLMQLLNYYGANSGKKPLEIDDTTYNQVTGFFTAPKTMVDFARSQGYEARCVSLAANNEKETQDQLIKLIENDIPVMIVTRPNPSKPRLLHYVIISGFEKRNGEIKDYTVIDSWEGELKWTPKQLESFWSGLPYNASHCMILVTTKDKAALLPPEKPHRGYEFMEGVALTETGTKVQTSSFKDANGNAHADANAGVFFDINFNHHINKNLDWNNYLSFYFGKNVNNENCASASNLESFLGKTNKSENWKSETKLGLAIQSYNQPWFSETFAGGMLGIKQSGKNFEYSAAIKSGFLNGKPGAAAEAEFDWIIYGTRKPMTLREWKLFLQYRKSYFFNGEDGPQIIQGGIKYEF